MKTVFGYISIYEAELKMKDYRRYKAYYCGLCRALKERFGSLGQMTLSYDMTFVIMLLNSLYECEEHRMEGRCKVHPLRKQKLLQSEVTDYAADMNMILSYYHLRDDWADERKLKALLGLRALRRRVKKVENIYPRQSRMIRRELKKITRLEQEDSRDVDQISGCFGKIMAEILVYRKDHWEETLRHMGFFLGKFIYLMDAYDDLEQDLKKGLYNPLKYLRKREDYEEYCRRVLCMMIAEVSADFERMPCLQDADILRNILYEGVWNRYRRMHGQSQENRVS